MNIDEIKNDILNIKNFQYDEEMPFTINDYYDFFTNNFPDLYFIDKYNKIFFKGLAVIDGNWNSIPSNYFSMIILKIIKKYIKEPKLCDLGCGIGNVVYFSEKLGYKSIGIEIQNTYNKHYLKYNIDVINNNLLDIDYSFLENIDIVYIYRPIINKDIMQKIIDKIYDKMKINSFLYFENGENLNFNKFKPVVMKFNMKNLMIKME